MLEFTTLSIEEFDQFTQTIPTVSFVQSKAMAKVLSDQHRLVECYGIKKDGKVVAGGLFNFRKVISKYTIAHCNQGPYMDFDNQEMVRVFFDGLKKELKKKAVLHAIITPNFEVVSRDENGEVTDEFDHHQWIENLKQAGLAHLGYDNSLINGVGRWFFVKDLQGISTSADLLKSFNQSGRTRLNRAKNSVMEIHVLNDDLSPFLEIMDHTASRRDFSNRQEDYYHSLLTHFGDNCRLYLARIDLKKQTEVLVETMSTAQQELDRIEQSLLETPQSKKLIGRQKEAVNVLASLKNRVEKAKEKGDQVVDVSAAMFIIHQDEMTYLFSGTYEEYFQYDAPYLIQEEAMTWAIEKGVKRINFYGTQGKYSGQEDDGVYIFKRNFNGRVLEQPGNFECVVNPIMNKLYQLSRKVR